MEDIILLLIFISQRKRLLDKQKLEALRQIEVGKAIERLIEEDRCNRQALGKKLQQRMTEAEMRKRRREQDSWRVSNYFFMILDNGEY